MEDLENFVYLILSLLVGGILVSLGIILVGLVKGKEESLVEDESFEELKSVYNLPARLVEGIRTVETTQKGKPLQVFDNPNPGRNYHIRIPFPEFTSLCPKTGQPDFATVTVDYVPDKVAVELKALKLYYNSYRNEGHFIEELANLILNDLVAALSPKWITVRVEFNVRGGMSPIVEVKWKKEME